MKTSRRAFIAAASAATVVGSPSLSFGQKKYDDGATDTTIVICTLDNLGKGAAGQAIQNANLALGLDPWAGLRLNGVLV